MFIFDLGRSNSLCSLQLQGRTRQWRKTNRVVWSDFLPVDKNSECTVQIKKCKKKFNYSIEFEKQVLPHHSRQTEFAFWKLVLMLIYLCA